MLNAEIFHWLHLVVGWLLQPVTWALFVLSALAIVECGIALGERLGGLQRCAQLPTHHVERLARRRIERTDLVGRIGPMLGLMGTLIPLGPGLAALGSGDVQILGVAMRVAFDTTVLGLLTGIIGFLLGRLRRRWYEELLDRLEQEPAS